MTKLTLKAMLMHPLADYIPSVIFVAAAIAIPSDVNLEEQKNEEPIAIVSSVNEPNEISSIETLPVKESIELIEEKAPAVLTTEVVASSF